MDEYVPYIALLVVALGLGGPAIWVVLRGGDATTARQEGPGKDSQ